MEKYLDDIINDHVKSKRLKDYIKNRKLKGYIESDKLKDYIENKKLDQLEYNINTYVDKIFYINMDKDIERNKDILNQFKKFNITNYERIPGVVVSYEEAKKYDLFGPYGHPKISSKRKHRNAGWNREFEAINGGIAISKDQRAPLPINICLTLCSIELTQG